MGYLDSNGLARFYAGLKSRFVRTINGVGPDANGNVAISSSGSVGDPVTDHRIELDLNSWIQNPSVGYGGGDIIYQFVTIPGSLPTDTPYIYSAIDVSHAISLQGPIMLINTLSSDPAVTTWDVPSALAAAGIEAAEDKWVVVRPNEYTYNITGNWSLRTFIFHGSNGTGVNGWYGNGICNGGDLSIDSGGQATVTDAAFTRLSTNKLISRSVEKDNITLGEGEYYNTAISVSSLIPSGYEIVALRSFAIGNASSGGKSASVCHIYAVVYSNSDKTVTMRVRNNTSSAAKVKLTVAFLCAPATMYT